MPDPRQEDRLEDNKFIRSCPAEKGLGVLVGERLDRIQQCVLPVRKPKHNPGCTRAGRSRRSFGPFPLMTTWRSVPGSAQGRRIQGGPGRCSVELEHLSSEERLRQLEELSLEKSLLVAAFQYLKEAYTKEAETDSDRTRGNG